MNVIELAKQNGAWLLAGDEYVMSSHQLTAFAEAIKRDLLDVVEEPVVNLHIFSDEIKHINYCKLPSGTYSLFTAEQMAHSRSEAVSKQKEKDAKICDAKAWEHESARFLGGEMNCQACAIAIRNQGE